MTLSAGVHLGPYEIVGPIGAGGMGEVYRARDSRLGRDVAVKVLPAAFARDPDRLRRFEQEARAAGSLNHPNILAVYDIGVHEGSPYMVTELLEGETLRQRLGEDIPQRKAVDYAVQTARGLAAAHQKGITHRDLKPENLFLTRDGRIKILDFGLAKLVQVEYPQDAKTLGPSAARPETEPGSVLGTPGYMSPEQVRGETIDPRCDIFTFGANLYEMLTGQRAFRGASGVESMNAILKDDPIRPDLNLPGGLESILRRCLEKNPEERFQSANDLGFALEAVAGVTVTAVGAPAPVTAPRRWRSWQLAAALGVLVVAAVAGYLAGQRGATSEPPLYRQLTFRRGTIQTAQFAPDGQTIVYSAAWEGRPYELFSTRADSPESRPLGITDAEIFSIASTGEMALALKRRILGPLVMAGMLARAPLGGGAPRELAEDVQSADWSPDGKELVVARHVGGKSRIEFPVGKVLYEVPGPIWPVRMSPKGDRIAFCEMPDGLGGGWSVSVLELSGSQKKTILSGLTVMWGMTWSRQAPEEIWFSAARSGEPSAVYAISPSGRLRLIERVPGNLALRDTSRDGRVLLMRHNWRSNVAGAGPGETQERDLSWLDVSFLSDLANDGKALLLLAMEPTGASAIYLRNTGGSPAVRLGDSAGFVASLSPDGKWVLASRPGPKPQLVLLPTRAGEIRTLAEDNLTAFSSARWLADGRRFLFAAMEPGRASRLYLRGLEGTKSQPVSPEGVGANGEYCISPDGKLVAAVQPDQTVRLYPIHGGEARPVAGALPGDLPSRFSADGRALFLFRRNELPIKVYRLDLATGRRQLWKQLAPPDLAGAETYFTRVLITPDEKSYAYSYDRLLSELYVVEGLR